MEIVNFRAQFEALLRLLETKCNNIMARTLFKPFIKVKIYTVATQKPEKIVDTWTQFFVGNILKNSDKSQIWKEITGV